MSAEKFHPGDFRRGLRRAGITAIEYRIAVELSEYAGLGRAVVWPAVPTIAADCEVSCSTVNRALNKLEAKGFIACSSRSKGGRGCTTHWRLLINPVTSDTVSDVNPVTGDTVSGTETLSSVTETLSPVRQNPVTGDRGSSKEPDQEVVKEPPNPPDEPPPSTALVARTNNGAQLARDRLSKLPARSIDAYRIAEAFSASLPTPIERGLLAGIGVQIDKCLESNIRPAAIAEGLKAWTASDSWSPTQIPSFVHKANSRHTSAAGKPTQKAVGWQQACEELLAEVETL
jgi:hypothetical protein